MKVELDGLCFGFSAVDKFLGEQCDFSCIPECIIFGHDLCLFWNAGLRGQRVACSFHLSFVWMRREAFLF